MNIEWKDGKLTHGFTEYSYSQLEEIYENHLDEIYPDQKAFDENVYANDFKKYSPTTFRCGCCDFVDAYYYELPNNEWIHVDDHTVLSDWVDERVDFLENGVILLQEAADLMMEINDEDEIISKVESRIESIEDDIKEIQASI